MEFSTVLKKMPLFPVLTGIFPHAVNDVTDVLMEAGFLCVAVPLSSPEAYASIQQLCLAYNNKILMGGSEVKQAQDVEKIANQGANLIISANDDAGVITRAKQLKMSCISSCTNVDESSRALALGADAILYTLNQETTLTDFQQLRDNLPQNAKIILASNSLDHMKKYWEAGASGFLIGEALYTPDIETKTLAHHAKEFSKKMEHLLK
jgi:2-dehydro-3-deoxyphosphogalactonate aldolase